jgi:hypothetical protein
MEVTMSRYKNIGGLGFDKKASHKKATSEQLELLSAAENIPLDDLLDEGLSQGEIRRRLTDIFHADVIPYEVIERRRRQREAAAQEPICRICAAMDWKCEGRITRHHFIPRWLMLQLENYQAYAARVRCTIPICVGRHRDLHIRGDEDTPKSIVEFLNDRERKFAQKMLDELRKQHPAIFDLIAGGDEATYEAQLIKDYMAGRFREASGHAASAVSEAHRGMELAI